MKRHFSLLALILVASLTFPGVAAAANDTANTTTTAVPSGPSGPSLGDGTVDLDRDATTYTATVGPVTKLVDWDYEDGAFHLILESKVPNMVTLTENVAVRKGATTFNAKRITVPAGRSKITMQAAPVEGAAAISLTTSQSLSAGSGLLLSTDDRTGTSPFAATSSTAGWLGGAGVSVFVAGLAAWQRKHKDHGDVRGVE